MSMSGMSSLIENRGPQRVHTSVSPSSRSGALPIGQTISASNSGLIIETAPPIGDPTPARKELESVGLHLDTGPESPAPVGIPSGLKPDRLSRRSRIPSRPAYYGIAGGAGEGRSTAVAMEATPTRGLERP